MSISNPTMDWKEEGFETHQAMLDHLQKFLDSKPQDTAPFSKNIPVQNYGERGKLHNSIQRVSYTGKWIIEESEGHEVDSMWIREVESERYIGFNPANKVSQAAFAQARR